MQFNKLLNSIIALCAAGLFSCSDDSSIINYDNQEATTYISLIINAPSQTRATANIDGEEAGIRHENEIKNLSLFFYHAGDKGLDMPDDTQLVGSLYIDDISLDLADGTAAATKAYPLNGFVPTEGDKIVAVANMGDITSLNRLVDVRDYLVENTYKYAPSIPLYSEFTMANAINTADDGKVEVTSASGTKLGSKDNPYTATVTLERTAARIDFAFLDTYYDESQSEVVFPIRNSANATIARAHITHVLPVNAMQHPAYLIRRVSSSATSLQDVKYCGDETDSNYVIEPTTLLKSTSAGIDINNWYGTTRASNFRETSDIFSTSNSLAALLSAEAPRSFSSTNTSDNRYVTIDYVNENTQSQTLNDSRFLTGLAIRAIYEPETVYSNGDATSIDGDDYSTGRTFWRYSPSRQDFAEEQCLYFKNQADAETYRANHPEDVAEITCYEGGICYYNMWIHHAPTVTSDPQETYPMDYAIVRNNIYRVSVSFTGPGDPKPDIREPNNIQSRVFVRAWNFRQQPTIIM